MKFIEINRKLFKKVSANLSLELILSFLLMFAFVVTIAFSILYSRISFILQTNSENNTIRLFNQSDFNIGRFCGDIDLLSRQLIVDAKLQEMNTYNMLPKGEQYAMVDTVLREFTDIINNYKYVDSVIFYGHDGLIVKSSISRNIVIYGENSKDDWYYKTKTYAESMRLRQKIVWFGGYSSADFVFSDTIQSEQAKVNYITASRSTFQANNEGLLLINIKESYFASSYDHAEDSTSRIMYIANDSGVTISSKDQTLLGSKPELFSSIDPNLTMGEFIVDGKSGKTQVVYYKLQNFPGVFINETPLSEILKEINYVRNILIVLFLLSLGMALILSRYWIHKLLLPLSRLTGVIRKVGHGNLGLTMETTSKNELGVLVKQFNLMSTGIRDLFSQNEKVQTEKRDLEMETLRSQINPHFIYNTLNTIKWMAVINKANNIVESVATLSDFLEPIFKNHDPMCTLEEEMKYIRNYVKIMNYRFAGGFALNIDLPADLAKCVIIRFILQPVVENALVHGLMGKVTGRVDIKASVEGEVLYLHVRDDGDGIDETRLEQIREALNQVVKVNDSSIGLSNVNRRIRLQYGDDYGITIHSVLGEGSEVTLSMPYKQRSANVTLEDK